MGREVNIPIRVRVKQAIQGLGKFGAKVQQVTAKSRAHFKAANAASGQLGSNLSRAGRGFAVIGGGVAVAVAAINKFTAMGDNAAKTADKLGVGVEALQEWRYAAERSGMASAELDKSLEYLVRSAGETAAGTGSAKDVFKGLGISVKDANGHLKGGGQLMEEVADKLSKVENPTARATIAYKLFGRSGMGMVNMLKDGSAGLKQYAKEARETGAVISEATARQSEKFQDLFLDVKRFGQGVGVTILSAVLPGVNKITEYMLTWAKANREVIATKITYFLEVGANVAIGFYKGLRAIYNGMGMVWAVVKSIIPGLDELTGSMDTWQTVGKVLAGVLGGYLLFALFAATKAVALFTAALLANPITWVVAGVAALAAAVYLIYDNWGPIAAWFTDLWAGISASFNEFFAPLVNLWTSGAEAVTAAWDGVAAWFTGLWDRVLAAFDAGGFTAAAFELLLGFLEGLLTGTGAVMAWAWDLPRRILKALLPEDWYNAGSSMLDQLLGGLVSGAGKVLSWAGGLVGRMLRALLPESWYNAGASMVGALRDGLASAVDTLTSWMPDWVREKLGISVEGGGSSPGASPATPTPAIAPAYGPRGGGQGGKMNGTIKVQFENAPPGMRVADMELVTDQDMDLFAGMNTSMGMF